jgi:hypothetical protein
MHFTQTVPLAWGMHGDGGWWIAGAALMMLCMGGMMRGMGGGSSQSPPAPSDTRASTESPVETLDRRLAEGAISIEEYQARHDALVNASSGSNSARKEEPLTAAPGGRQQ